MVRLVSVLMAVVASSALAVAPGGSLYIACKDLKLLKAPKASAPAASPSVMPEGEEVRWLGASAKDKSFHEVEFRGKKGFVHMGCLKPNKPMAEIDSALKPVSPQAGYPPTQRYAGGSKAEQDAAAELAKLEELNKSIDAAAIAAKEKELHGGK